jgi:hypothetical protein
VGGRHRRPHQLLSSIERRIANTGHRSLNRNHSRRGFEQKVAKEAKQWGRKNTASEALPQTTTTLIEYGLYPLLLAFSTTPRSLESLNGEDTEMKLDLFVTSFGIQGF